MEKVIREVIKRRTTRASEERVWEKEERENREREREYNNEDSDVGCDEDKCIEERSGLGLMFFQEIERERRETIHFFDVFPTWGLVSSGLREICLFFGKQSGPLCGCLNAQHHVIRGHYSSPIRDF
jgi:hypothetical protein